MKKLSRSLILIFTFILVLSVQKPVNAASGSSYYALDTVNVRRASNGSVIGTKRFGDYINGNLSGSYVYFYYNGVYSRVSAKYVKRATPSTRYVKASANMRNRNLSVVGKKYKGETLYSVRLGNYYRFYENGSPKFVHYSLVTSTPTKGGVYVTNPVNIRSSATGNVLGTYRTGKYVYGLQKGDYIYFYYNGTYSRIHKSLVKYDKAKYRTLKYSAHIYNDRFNVVGTKSAGSKILSVKIGNYYRYFSNGAKFIHSGNVYDSATSAPTTPKPTIPETSYSSPKLYTLSQFKYQGIVYWNGYKYTYYSQSVLPGPGLTIPGRHVNKDGYVSDGNGYIVLANDAAKGKVFPTPFGYLGKVYDRGTYGNHLDVYIK